MILKIVENVSSKGIFHVVKTAVDLSIFSKLPFFNYNFLKLPQKFKKPRKTGDHTMPRVFSTVFHQIAPKTGYKNLVQCRFPLPVFFLLVD